MTDEAFVIMQIGSPELDRIWADAIVPAIEASGLVARRVDRHNTGDLLKTEIVRFIERAKIIVADLTNERPNCYLEIGYAMGLGRTANLILTARSDHLPGSPSHKPGGPKVHFDVAGYDILFWDPTDKQAFQQELSNRIKRRLAVVSSRPGAGRSNFETEWFEEHRTRAEAGLQSLGLSGGMEVSLTLESTASTWTQRKLLEAARESEIRTFGWPIGIVLERDEYRPRPRADGIVAEVPIRDSDIHGDSYDYWALRQNGDFYLLQSLFEDQRRENSLFFNTRIVRIAESVLYARRLYSRLDVAPSTRVSIKVRHIGLAGRVLTSTGSRHIGHERQASSDEISTRASVLLGSTDSHIVDVVKDLLAPVFVMFDFFEISDDVYTDIIDKFIAGQVT